MSKNCTWCANKGTTLLEQQEAVGESHCRGTTRWEPRALISARRWAWSKQVVALGGTTQCPCLNIHAHPVANVQIGIVQQHGVLHPSLISPGDRGDHFSHECGLESMAKMH